MLWKKRGKASIKGNDLAAFIGEGSEIEGKFTFSGTVMLNGLSFAKSPSASFRGRPC
jgi:hypothetical protein